MHFNLFTRVILESDPMMLGMNYIQLYKLFFIQHWMDSYLLQSELVIALFLSIVEKQHVDKTHLSPSFPGESR